MSRDSERRLAQLLVGLGLGLLFGLALQKSGVTNYDVILGTLRLQQMTVAKVMLSAIIVGSIGVYCLRHLGVLELQIRPASVGGNVVGGVLFGVGFALLGYCPGTAMGAVGEARLDALFGGVVGMMLGSGLYAVVHTDVNRLLRIGRIGDKTLWQLLDVRPWVVLVPLIIAIVALLWWFEIVGL